MRRRRRRRITLKDPRSSLMGFHTQVVHLVLWKCLLVYKASSSITNNSDNTWLPTYFSIRSLRLCIIYIYIYIIYIYIYYIYIYMSIFPGILEWLVSFIHNIFWVIKIAKNLTDRGGSRIPRIASYPLAPNFRPIPCFLGGRETCFSFKNPRWQSEKDVVFVCFFFFGTQRNVYHEPILKRPFWSGYHVPPPSFWDTSLKM